LPFPDARRCRQRHGIFDALVDHAQISPLFCRRQIQP
jgi:hypothetical protein